MTDTNKLLLDYAHQRSESAFRELVTRYLDLVYSVALRRAGGNAHTAEDIAQSVFTDLARKAGDLPANVRLGGWLHRHTCFVASTTLRSEHRRQNRERQAAEMNSINAAPDETWLQLGPVLDEAIDQLEASDREAIVLRYFEQRDLRAVGAALGIGEDAAQKRVSRAVDKLRDLIGQRGVAITTTVLAGSLAASAVSTAPAGLAGSIGSKALVAGVSVGFAASLLHLLTAAKVKLALGAAVLVLLALSLVIQKIRVTNQSSHQRAPLTKSVAETRTVLTNTAFAPGVSSTNAAAKLSAAKESGLLRLTIVSADGGQPIPNVPIDYRRWDRDKFTGRTLQSPRLGVCEVFFPQETTTELELTTRVDGFADTRLHWSKAHGDEIPAEYTLRLDRAVPIGGRVVDADGQPVVGAKVGFNHNDDPTTVKWPEDHDFSWIEVSTDQDGHWRINRMADEVIRQISGGAGHPEHVDAASFFLSGDHAAERKLREGSFVFQLGRPVQISGMVVDADGMTVSNAEVLVGGRSESGNRTAKTAVDGTFTVKGCRPGKIMVTAEAKGYAATTIEVTHADREPVRIVLQPGRILRLRVVNQAGQPIPRANVWLNTFRHGPTTEPRPVLVQATFYPRTDQQGLVVWSNAPDAELQFDIAASGYMRTNQFKVRPDDEEHLVTLAPAVVVSGQVTDANTGEPIPRFQVIIGWPRQDVNGQESVDWSIFGGGWLSFAGGKYRHSFEDAMVRGVQNPGYALKFEAKGYAPFVSRSVKADEGEDVIRLDVKLTPAESITVSVVLPDGRAAANADVGLAFPGARLELVPGGFNRVFIQNGGSLLSTDKKGRFSLPADASIQTVMVAHPSGFAQVSRAELTAMEFIQLQAWGRLEGVAIKDGKPVADREFTLQFEQLGWDVVSFGFNAFHVASDKKGKFVFAQVPPGKLKLVRLVKDNSIQPGTGWMHQPLQSVEIRAGETAQVTVGGSGYTVTARLSWPDGFKNSSGARIAGWVLTAPPAWIREMAADPLRRAGMAKLPEVQEYGRNAHTFHMEINPDGTLSAESVPPGVFEVAVYVSFGGNTGSTNELALTGRVRVTVPADPATGMFNVGEIVLIKP